MAIHKIFILANTEFDLQKSPQEIIAKVRELESSCYDRCIDLCIERGINKTWSKQDFVATYSACCYKLMYHLDFTLNTHVGFNETKNESTKNEIKNEFTKDDSAKNDTKAAKKKLYEKVFETKEDLALLDLCPDAISEEREMFELQSKQKLEEKVGSFIICVKPSCKSREITWVKYQGRCADEQENYSYRCLKCNHQWHV